MMSMFVVILAVGLPQDTACKVIIIPQKSHGIVLHNERGSVSDLFKTDE